MSAHRDPLHYVGLAIAVFVGVAAARIFVDYVEAQIVVQELGEFTDKAVRDMREFQSRTERKLAEQRARAESQRQSRIETVQEKRRTSRVGRDLYRRCVEFMRFHEENPSDYALEQRQKSCKRYNTYIETGRRET